VAGLKHIAGVRSSASNILGPRVQGCIKLVREYQHFLSGPTAKHRDLQPAAQHLRIAMLPLAKTCALRTARSSLRRASPASPLPSSILSRLASTLAILEQREGKLNASSLGAITAAQKIGGSIHGFVAGPKSVAEAAAKVKGLEKVLMVENSAYDKVGTFSSLEIEGISE
jgi:hypothetical protein